MSCSCNNLECSVDNTTELIKVQVNDKNALDLLEREFYEFNGLLNLLKQFTSDSPYKPDNERYEKVLVEYLEKFTTYNLVYQHIIDEALNDLTHIERIDVVNTQLQFVSGIITLEVKRRN